MGEASMTAYIHKAVVTRLKKDAKRDMRIAESLGLSKTEEIHDGEPQGEPQYDVDTMASTDPLDVKV